MTNAIITNVLSAFFNLFDLLRKGRKVSNCLASLDNYPTIIYYILTIINYLFVTTHRLL